MDNLNPKPNVIGYGKLKDGHLDHAAGCKDARMQGNGKSVRCCGSRFLAEVCRVEGLRFRVWGLGLTPFHSHPKARTLKPEP